MKQPTTRLLVRRFGDRLKNKETEKKAAAVMGACPTRGVYIEPDREIDCGMNGVRDGLRML